MTQASAAPAKKIAFMRRFRRAFTLTELLVVIGIIAVLSAILLPVFWSVRANGQRSVCASNLRQITAASLLYAQDNDGVLPHSEPNGPSDADWFSQIMPFLKNKGVFRCPACALPDVLPEFMPEFMPAVPVVGYAANSNINNVTNDKPLVREGDVPYPSATVLFTEVHFIQRPGQGTAIRYAVIGPDVLDATNWGPGYSLDGDASVVGLQGGRRHSGGSNYSFVDGHVQWLKPEAVDWRENDENGCPLPPPNGTRPSFKW